MALNPSPVAWSPRTSSTSCSARWSTASSPPVTRCPASVGWPRCSASPVRPCARPCSASPRRAWWRSATVAARPSATTAPRPASTCSPVSWSATASSTRRSVAASCRPARRSPRPWPPWRPSTPAAPPPRRSADAVTALEQAEGSEARQHAALAFWDAVVDAADSIVFRLLFNSLRMAYEPAITALGPVMDAEVDNLAGYRALATAISVGAPDEARDGRRPPATPGHRRPGPAARTPRRSPAAPPVRRKDHDDQAQPRDRGQGPRATGSRRAADGLRPG